jgi:hypothetical protein
LIQRLRNPWTTPCTRCTGPRWTAPKGHAPFKSESFASDRTVLDACVRRITAHAPETGVERRRFAGGSPAHPNPAHRASNCARASSTHSWGNRTLLGGQGGGPRTHGGRHRKGAARGSPPCGRRCCGASPNQRMTGKRCSPHGEGPGELTGEEKATVRRLNDGGGSGGAPV